MQEVLARLVAHMKSLVLLVWLPQLLCSYNLRLQGLHLSESVTLGGITMGVDDLSDSRITQLKSHGYSNFD